jgi:hypothetical protein
MTQEEIKLLEKLSEKDPLLKSAYDEIMGIHTYPTKIFYKELIQTVMALSKELEFIRTGKKELANIIGADDKTFERVTKLLTDSEKIFSGLRKGKDDVFPDEAKSDREKESEEGLSFTDRLANKKRKSN